MTRLGRALHGVRGAAAALVSIGLVVAIVSAVGPLRRVVPDISAIQEPAGLRIQPEGQDVPRLAPILVTFPAEPAPAKPDELVRVEPAVRGSYAWMSPRTLLFQPDFPGLMRGATYTVHVPGGPATGLGDDVRRKFTVAGRLAVSQVIPGDGDAGVPTNAQVIVQFSRSVAPLTTLSAQRTDPVVSFDPPLEGQGEWLNTSIYRFIPKALRPSTTYRMRVAKGLASAADGALESDFTWSFATITPHVAAILPDDNAQFASPTQQVVVTFDQPMDPSAASGIAVRDQSGGSVPGTVTFDAERIAATFTPAVELGTETVYIVSVEAGLRGARGGGTAALRTSSFRTVGRPTVAAVNPPDGSSAAGRFGVSIRFSNPMDRSSLEGKLRVSGFTAGDLEGKVNIDEGMVVGPKAGFGGVVGGGIYANVTLRPSTRYTADLLPGAKDRYGQVMGAHSWSFTTGALPSSVFLALPGYMPGVTYSATTEPILWYQATNLPSVGFTLWPLTADEGRRMLHDFGSNAFRFEPSQPALRSWTETITAAQDETVLRSTSVSGGGPLPKGDYFVRTGGQFRSQFAFAVVDTAIVTKLSQNELVAWALDHDSGKPLAGATITANGPGVSPERAVTDGNGLATFSVPVPLLGASWPNIDRSYYLTLEGAGHSGVTSTRWSQGISPYQFSIPSEYFARQYVGQVYTDRPLYRPGETVEYKGIVRLDDDAAYAVPPADVPLDLVIVNPRGQEARHVKLGLNDFGTFAGSFEVPADSPVGDFSIQVRMSAPGAPAPNVAAPPKLVPPPSIPAPQKLVPQFTVFLNSFRIAEFRKPEYQVTVSTARPSYVDGDRIEASTAASFFFGGALANAPVRWSVLGSPFAMKAKGYERYSFTDDDATRQAARRDPLRASGTATTGADGVASWSLPATLPSASDGAQQLTVSATVTDQNGQGVAGSTTVTLHPAQLYAGIRPARHVARVGERATIDLVTVDTDGTAVGTQPLAVRVYDRQWVTTREETPTGRRYTSTPKDTLLATLDATSGTSGEAHVAFAPASAGSLRFVAEIRDAAGRSSRSSTTLWVSGESLATWQITNDDTIKLVADKDRYEVGETADVLVPAPFSGATALVTIERGKVITRSVRHLATNSERLRIPIEERSVPNVFVSVVLYRGPTAADPLPRYKVGYVELPVSTATRTLTVSVRPDREQARPGDTVRYAFTVKDRAGRGVRAEVSVAVVDKALLSLAEERGPDGLHAFWFQRGLGVSTASSISVSMDRANDVISEPARSGKGGAGSGGLGGPRAEFRNTAYWTAQLVTADDGTASVEVKMPDDLTTWRLQARAVSGDTMVGEGTNELTSTQPLLVRPALPRFLRVGDSAEIRALVTNATTAETKVNVRLKAEGVSVSGADARTATIAAGGTATVSWPATVATDGRARFTFTASGSGGLADVVTNEVPVLMAVTPETMATGGIVTDKSALEAIYLPPFARQVPGSLSVSVRSALVGTMADELDALAPTPYEGPERVASRLIATLGVRRAELSAYGSSDRYEGRIVSDAAGLVGRQRPDGGWAWCDDPQCATDPFVSGHVLLALGEARRDQIALDAGVLDRATVYVRGVVSLASDVASPADPSQRAFLLAALASADGGAATTGTGAALLPARALFEQYRSTLTSWGRAYLILALADQGVASDDPMIRALFADLSAAALPSANGAHWEDGQTRGSFMTGTAATGLVTLALARIRPDHALLPQSVRWLTLTRGAGGWHSSIERAMGVLALATYATRTGELAGDFSYGVTLGTRSLLAGVAKPTAPLVASKVVPLTQVTPGQVSVLALSRETGTAGRLYYTLDLRYVTPAQGVEAVDRGFGVVHEYTALDDPSTPLASITLGETVRVKLTVMVPADRAHVTVEDLLPAGLEPVDARLRTVDPKLKAQLDADRMATAEKRAGVTNAPWMRWYYSPWQHVELRDDRAVLYAERVSKGVYDYVYYARATTPGDFFVAPAHAEESYFPEVFGRSDSGRFTVVP